MKICFYLFTFFYVSQVFALQTIYIASAANFSKSLQKISTLFENSNKDVRIKIISGSSGVLAEQIQSGAPFDIFFSADKKYIEYLENGNKTQKGTDFTFAVGRLVFLIPNKNIKGDNEQKIKQTLILLKSPIALADPVLAPFGVAGREVIDRFYTKTEQKNMLFIYGRNIEQAFSYVDTGSASSGFVSLSNVLEKQYYANDYLLIPQKYYSPIVQRAAILSQTKNSKAAKKFIDFFRNSEDVRSILTQSGYDNVLSQR